MAGNGYSREFKVDAVRLVSSGVSVRQAARDLGVSEVTLRGWVKRAQSANTPGQELTEAEELRQLRAENKRLRMEREILKKATAFFAKDQS